jgi:hypothetical protein
MLRSTMSLSLALLVTALLAGCSGAYVNIPHEPGDLASQDPNSSRVRDLLAKSCREIVSTYNLSTPVALELPEATTRKTHAVVAADVPGAIAPGAQTQAQAATTLKITGIRVRGTNGQVDVRAPTRPGSEVDQLITAYAHWAAFSNWTVQRTKVWPGVTAGNE